MGDLFSFGSVAMARVPLFGSAADPASGEAPHDEGLFTEGLFLSSRSAADAGDPGRAAATRAAYAIRARSRTTPHGVWCGVAPAGLEGDRRDPSTLRLGGDHRAVSAPSPLWLWECADRMLEQPGVVERLHLTANDLAVRRGDRIEAEHPAPGGGRLGSVRATELSVWLMAHCADRTRGEDAVAAVLDRYPGASAEAARSALVQMIRTGLLLTDLLPGDLRHDPIGHLLARAPETAAERPYLLRLRRVLGNADRCRPGAARRILLLRAARRLTDRVHVVDRPIVVDTLADADVRLPADVGRRAAEAAGALWRIGQRTSPLGDWSRRFVAAYGHQRAVPLTEAVDPAVGIGPPGALDAVAAVTEPDEGRERALAHLLTEALRTGRTEIELSEEHIARLAHRDDRPPCTAEIHVRVLLGPDGSFRLVVGRHSAQTAGSAAGRFAPLLPPLAPRAPADGPEEPVVAEIVCSPAAVGTAGLTAETGFAPHRIPVGVPHRDGDLRLRDLAVVSTGRHLALWSRDLRRQVRPVLFSRITRDLLPGPARLLHLLGHAAERPWHAWSWGRIDGFPYTPRISYRGTVLATQRWLLPDALIAAASGRRTWRPRLAQWLAEVRPPLPGTVVAEESDRHLPLVLGDVAHQEVLRRAVLRGTRSVAEAFGHASDELPVYGPRGRHALELVVPLYRATVQERERIDPRTALRPRTADTRTPGTDWLSVALAVPARHQDAVLRQLPPVPDGTRSFWLRYRTEGLGPHLRLRYQGAPGPLRAVSEVLARWCADLYEQRLSDGLVRHEPYVRETQRYGGAAAVPAAEAVFAADSAFALAALRAPDGTEPVVIAAVSAAAIATALAAPNAARGGPLARAERRERERLRSAVRDHAVPAGLARAWARREGALAAYGALLPAPPVAELCAADLIHLHCNRLLGTDPGRERIVRSLATDLLHARG